MVIHPVRWELSHRSFKNNFFFFGSLEYSSIRFEITANYLDTVKDLTNILINLQIILAGRELKRVMTVPAFKKLFTRRKLFI